MTDADAESGKSSDTEDSAVATAEPEPVADEPKPTKSPWWERRYTFCGTALGLIFLWFSMTPSLLPRGPLFQGLVSGSAGAIGYGIGVFLVWLVRYMRSKDTSPPAPRWAWVTLVIVGVIGQILMIIWFHVWQDDVRDLMGVPRLKFLDHPLAAVLSIVFLFVFDFLSVMERKNPLGAIEAFCAAFAPGEGAMLMLKSSNGDTRVADLERLRRAAAHRSDIVIRDGYLSADEMHYLLLLALSERSRDDFQDYDGTPYTLLEPDSVQESKNFTQEFRLQSDPKARLSWVAGGPGCCAAAPRRAARWS